MRRFTIGRAVRRKRSATASGAAKKGEALNAVVASEGDFGGSPPLVSAPQATTPFSSRPLPEGFSLLCSTVR